MRRLTVLVSLVVLSGAARAETLGFRFFDTEDGLPQLSVISLTQDREGALWIGTQNGLARFDGVTFQSWGPREGLEHDDVKALTLGPDGALWLATPEGLVARSNGAFKQEVTFPHPPLYFRHLAFDGAVLWCAGEAGLARYDGLRFTPVIGPEQPVSALKRGPDGALWFASTRGVGRLVNDAVQPVPGLEADAMALDFDGRGRLWLAQRDGWLRVLDGPHELRRISMKAVWATPQVLDLHVDRQGIVWLGGFSGLARVVDDQLELVDRTRGFPFFEVATLWEDRDGFMWFGAFGALVQFSGPAFTRFGASDGLGSDAVRPIVRDGQGTLWVGSTNGLGRFDGHRFETFDARHGLDGVVVRALAATSQRLWVGTANGLFLRDGERFRRPTGNGFTDAVVSLSPAADGSVWAVSDAEGLMHGVGEQFEKVAVPGLDSRGGRVLVDHEGRVWVTGRGGLACLDHGEWRLWTTADGLADHEPRTMAEGVGGTLWLGYAANHGLTHFDGQHFQTWTVADGLSHDSVFSIGLDAQGDVWAGTARGVDHFDGHRFRNYGPREGYPSAESNGNGFWRDTDGTLWFATAGGLGRYWPARDLPLDSAPTVSLSNVRFEQAASDRHDARSLMGDVFVSSFVATSQIEVEYRVGDEAWQRLDSRHLHVDGLDPGLWTLSVRARRYHGPWSASVSETVRLDAPPWQSWPFALVVVVLLTAAVWGGIAWRTRTLRLEQDLLEMLVSQRTAALESALDELRATQAHLEAANRLKSAFLANMSHEIRTPMNAVVGMATLLDGTRLDGEQREYVDTIRSSSALLLGIINDVLDLSKIEAGKLVLERTLLDPRELFESTLQLVSTVAFDKGLELACIVERDVPAQLWGDPTRLRQIALNLLSNAVKFTARGEVVLQVRWVEQRLQVEVRDTGIGIAPETLGVLFTSFSQADASTTRRFGGTGLGLSICRLLVQAMGGDIGVDSKPDEGSRFWFALPLEATSAERPRPLANVRLCLEHAHAPTRRGLEEMLCALGAELVDLDHAQVLLSDYAPSAPKHVTRLRLVRLGQVTRLEDPAVMLPGQSVHVARLVQQAVSATSAPAPLDVRTPASLAGKRVLVAEDNLVNQRVAARMLERLGLVPTVVGDGAQALAALQGERFDLVMMDCQMPVLDGYAAARAVRKLEGDVSRVPIVAVTASALDDERQRCLDAGIDDYLAKPIQLPALEQLLARWLPR